MLKQEYYCLIAGLPDLFYNENNSGISSLHFKTELKKQIDPDDFELVKLLYLPADHKNLINLLFKQNKPFDKSGNLSENFLDPNLEQPPVIPIYISQFIEWAKNKGDIKLTVEIENQLYKMFYEFALQQKNLFVLNWFTFELNIKNVCTAVNCKKFGYTADHQLIEVNQNSTVYKLLQSNFLKPDLFEEELPFAEQIFRIAESDANMLEKEKSIDKIKWDFLEENTFFHYFTIERILSFIIKLQIIERWNKLDTSEGKKLINKLINELKTSYKFPEEFIGTN